MTPAATLPREETLDPRDWRAFRALAHRMLDDMVSYLETVRDRPVWQPMPEAVRRSFEEPLPLDPQGQERAYRDFLEHVLPYPQGNIHPRFWGWVNGTGTPLAMLAEMLAAGMNPNLAGYDHAATLVETQVLAWLKEMLGFPPTASGLLVSGGSMANLVGLAVARDRQAGLDLRRQGLKRAEQPLTVYASEEVHSSVQKAVELLGLGSDGLRRVAVRKDLTLDLDALARALREDRRAGLRPIAVVGTAGTVNTGAIDDLDALADLCRGEGLWLHVDGAFGALAAISPRLRPLVRGLERADSLAFDLHKWLYMPYEAGCALVRSAEDHRATFSLLPPYLQAARGGLAAVPPVFSERGVELSRGFKALKVWLSFKAHGVRKFARLIEQNVAQARHLAQCIEEAPDLELMAPVPLNVVCFRFRAPDLAPADLDELNREILVRLQESGVAAPSSTVLQGRFCLRAAITNHRTRRSDLDLLVDESVRLGRLLSAAGVERPREEAVSGA